MTAPAISVETVEDIDLTPVCGHADNHADENRPRADYWLDQHGCVEDFACSPCFVDAVRRFAVILAHHGDVRCDTCGRLFTQFTDMCTRVVPLR